MNTYDITVCGLDIVFNSPADSERVEQAANIIQESYLSLQSQASQVSKDRILAIVAIGLAENLLELQKECSKLQSESEEKPLDGSKFEARIQKMLETLHSITPINN